MDQSAGQAYGWIATLLVTVVICALLVIASQQPSSTPADLATGEWELELRHCELFGEPSTEAAAAGFQCP